MLTGEPRLAETIACGDGRVREERRLCDALPEHWLSVLGLGVSGHDRVPGGGVLDRRFEDALAGTSSSIIPAAYRTIPAATSPQVLAVVIGREAAVITVS